MINFNMVATKIMDDLKSNPWSGLYLSDELKNNMIVANICLMNDGSTLSFFSEEIKNHKDLVLLAVSNNGVSIRNASDSLRKDWEVMTTAIQQDKEAVNYVDTEFFEMMKTYSETYYNTQKKNVKLDITNPENSIKEELVKNIKKRL